jgi:hypothetical protein
MAVGLGLGLALVLLAIAFALYPLFQTDAESAPLGADPVVARAALYQEILDAELDMRLGKITETDYQIIRGRLLHQAAQLMTAPEQEADEDPASIVEREIAAARASMHRGRLTKEPSPS